MGRYSDFLNAKRNQLGARDYAYGAEKAKYFNYTNPPQFPITDAEIRRRENMLLTARSELAAFINSEYPDSYMDKLSPDTRADLGIITSNQEGRNNLSAGLMNYMFQLLNSTDQSIYIEFLMRMDRGESRDMFLGVVDRSVVTSAAETVTHVAAVATVAATAYAFGAAIAGAGATGAGAATTSTALEATATANVVSSGTLAGSTGLLTGGGTAIAETSLAGTLTGGAVTATTTGGLAGLSGILSSAGTAITAAIGPEAINQVKALISNQNKAPNPTSANAANEAVQDAGTTFKKVVTYGSLLTALYYILT